MEKIKKHCPVCDLIKPATEFHKDKSKSDGLRWKCKACQAQAFKAYYVDNRESLIQAVLDRREKQKD